MWSLSSSCVHVGGLLIGVKHQRHTTPHIHGRGLPPWPPAQAMRRLMRHSSSVHKHSPQKHVTSMHPCNSKWLLFVINTKGCSVTAATGGRCCMVLGYWRIGHMSACTHGRPPTGFSQVEMGLNGEPSAGMHARGPFGAYDTSTSVEARDEEKEPTASSIYEFQPDGIMKWRSERWKCQRCRPSAIITHGVRIS